MRKTPTSSKNNASAKNGLKPLMSGAEIHKAIKKISKRIDKDYAGKTPLLVVTLKGSFLFAADIMKELKIESGLSFIRASSYGTKKEPLKRPDILYAEPSEFYGRHIIIIEDIIDRGVTIDAIVKYVMNHSPASVAICALLIRGRGMAKIARYHGKIIGKGFAVGYGLDYKEQHRGLKGIYALKNVKKE